MASVPKKVAVLGFDCALTHWIDKYIAEGHLPNFKKLFQEGVVCENSLAPYPTITPPNWAAIGTGAWPGTNCVTDFHVQDVGIALDNANIKQAFSSERIKGELLWDALDKAGKKCVVLNWPGAWPSHMKNGIMVGGAGLSISEYRDGRSHMNSRVRLCHDQLVATGLYPGAIRGKFEDADSWENLPEMGSDAPMEIVVPLRFNGAMDKPAPATWYVLAWASGNDGYDRVTLSPTRNFKNAFCTLKVGEWSKKSVTNIKMAEGPDREVFFRCKLIELSDDTSDFRLLIGSLNETSGWSSPSEIAKEIMTQEGTFAHGGGISGYATGWYDLDTYVEINDQNARFLGDAAESILKKHEWDAFFMHSHPTDWVYHILITDMDPKLCPDKAKNAAALDGHLKIYKAQDRLLGRLIQAMDPDTLFILISDHGATPDGTPFNPYNALIPKGLATLKEGTGEESKGAETGGRMAGIMEEIKVFKMMPDPAKSRAIPMRTAYVYVNLKGRDKDGIVDPKDYETVQQEIIDALYTYVDPITKGRPIALALSKKDARIIGLHGDDVGDVVYALYPNYGGQHGHILPTAEYGPGTLQPLLTFTGPGIKRGVRLARTVWLVDMVPTICYLMDWPVPSTVEGAIIYQVFKDPNFKMKTSRS